ncbi:6-bladed beta-propeller [Roseivirga sp. UBA1976]|uniref:6-bladed beta-propeller n=1 Tax=Roseivirga sp. UBA1976 TaxID=1947386 RepID=UPI00257F5F90|nr:6-bladed beta-propeller [Roseivirga sp. UBA1976]MEC7754797.1 6-bladed beta-propeller [Bacteroidota bacterium]|tara:strand:+ start:8461 stop:9564 length:1104 start_codon:yes stop_codon:yes gene_type:complete
MNSIYRTIGSLVFISLLLSCSPSKKDNNLAFIDIPVEAAKEIKLSTVAMEVDSIALETLENNLISRVINVVHNDGSLFVGDINALFKFTWEGKFIKQIGSIGQGPGEYLNVSDIALDKEKGYIYLASNLSQKIVCYDTDGNFIRETKVIGLNGVKLLAGSLYCIFTQHRGSATDKTKWFNDAYLIKFNQDFIATDTVLIKSVKANKGTASISDWTGDRIISEVNGEIYVYMNEVMKEPFVRDTLFKVKDGEKTASLKLNFGITNPMEEHLFVKSILRTENHLLIDFSVESYSGISVVELTGKKVNIAKGFFLDDVWNTGFARLMPWNLANEEFYFMKESMELAAVFDDIKGEENPILFIVKLKTGFL